MQQQLAEGKSSYRGMSRRSQACREVSRGHSSYRKRVPIKSGRTHHSSEGPNIKMFQIKQGFATSDSPVISGTGQDKKLND